MVFLPKAGCPSVSIASTFDRDQGLGLQVEFKREFASATAFDGCSVGQDGEEQHFGFPAALSGSQFKAPGSAGGYLPVVHTITRTRISDNHREEYRPEKPRFTAPYSVRVYRTLRSQGHSQNTKRDFGLLLWQRTSRGQRSAESHAWSGVLHHCQPRQYWL